MRLDTTDEYKRGAEIMDGRGMKRRCHMAGLPFAASMEFMRAWVAVAFAFHGEIGRRYGWMEGRDKDRLLDLLSLDPSCLYDSVH